MVDFQEMIADVSERILTEKPGKTLLIPTTNNNQLVNLKYQIKKIDSINLVRI
eukprot:Pgem_evm1s6176